MVEHWSERIIKDIVGAFKVFAISAVLIFGALAIAKTLYPSFPLDNSSYGIIAVILGIFISFINYVKSRATLDKHLENKKQND
jgi:predicted membrane chloride channel (bestrophin family)